MAGDSLGTRIRRARERKRLSQQELADAVGASLRAVGDWENDRRKPRNRLGALEEALEVSLDEDTGPPLTRLDEELGTEDADLIRKAVRETEPDRAEAILAGIEEKFRRRSAGG